MEKIGNVFVDSGLLMVCDPCYVLHKEKQYPQFGDNWHDFCDKFDGPLVPHPKIPDFFVEKRKTEIDCGGFGTAFQTISGDGSYGVYRLPDGNILIDIAELHTENKED